MYTKWLFLDEGLQGVPQAKFYVEILERNFVSSLSSETLRYILLKETLSSSDETINWVCLIRLEVSQVRYLDESVRWYSKSIKRGYTSSQYDETRSLLGEEFRWAYSVGIYVGVSPRGQ